MAGSSCACDDGPLVYPGLSNRKSRCRYQHPIQNIDTLVDSDYANASCPALVGSDGDCILYSVVNATDVVSIFSACDRTDHRDFSLQLTAVVREKEPQYHPHLVLRKTLTVLVLFSALFFTSNVRAAKVGIAPFSGKSGATCTNRIADFFEEHTTVEVFSQVQDATTWRELSKWLSARGTKVGVDIVILGSVSGRRIILEAYNTHDGKLLGLTKLYRKKKRCRLSRKSKRAAINWLRKIVGPGGLPDPVAPKPSVEPTETSTTTDTEKPVQKKVKKNRDPKKGQHGIGPKEKKEAFGITFELELSLLRRSFAYNNAKDGGHTIPASTTFGFQLEAFPFRSVRGFEPLRLAARYRHGLDVRTVRTKGEPNFDGRFSEVSTTLSYSVDLEAIHLEVSPIAGFHYATLTIDAPRGRTNAADLPDVAFKSILLGSGVKASIGERFGVRGSAGYLIVFDGGPVFDDSLFKGGSAYGMQAELGLYYLLLESLTFSLTGTYLTYSLDLGPGFELQKASDTFTAARIAIRMSL